MTVKKPSWKGIPPSPSALVASDSNLDYLRPQTLRSKDELSLLGPDQIPCPQIKWYFMLLCSGVICYTAVYDQNNWIRNWSPMQRMSLCCPTTTPSTPHSQVTGVRMCMRDSVMTCELIQEMKERSSPEKAVTTRGMSANLGLGPCTELMSLWDGIFHNYLSRHHVHGTHLMRTNFNCEKFEE